MRHPNKIATTLANGIREASLAGVKVAGNVSVIEAQGIKNGAPTNWTAGLVQVSNNEWAEARYLETFNELVRSDPLIDWDALATSADGSRRQVKINL